MMAHNPKVVAIVDVGSNSIKLLVAAAANPIEVLYQQMEEIRISTGMITSNGVITASVLESATTAIEKLLIKAEAFFPDEVLIVATSAVREASNSNDFIKLLKNKTGYNLRILTGREEALGIARGILLDEQLNTLQDFHLFDMGGGSIELIRFCSRKVVTVASFPLGAVRLTEQFVPDSNAPMPGRLFTEIKSYVLAAIAKTEFQGDPIPLVGAGGAMNVLSRLFTSAESKKTINSPHSATIFAIKDLETLFSCIVNQTLAERVSLTGLSPKRADIMPVAAATILSLAHYLQVSEIYYSKYNLRFGLAMCLLGEYRSNFIH
jgi:exopolyphosphatase/guanosine-5'-triphosphate,3'-diphosphate pyrophosphatase